nr:uroplakin-2 isoform X1 [Microcebus murinus]
MVHGAKRCAATVAVERAASLELYNLSRPLLSTGLLLIFMLSSTNGCCPRLTVTTPTPAGLADFNISSLSGLLSPALTESLLVALPPCHLTGGNATLMVRRANDSKVVKSSFVVPPCRGRRELVSVVDSGAGFTVTRLSAYQVTNLAPGTKYYISYLVKKGTSTESSREIPMSTLPRRNMESIGLGMARTGGMVVITVLLSVAMFLLVLGLIIALALGARK